MMWKNISDIRGGNIADQTGRQQYDLSGLMTLGEQTPSKT